MKVQQSAILNRIRTFQDLAPVISEEAEEAGDTTVIDNNDTEDTTTEDATDDSSDDSEEASDPSTTDGLSSIFKQCAEQSFYIVELMKAIETKATGEDAATLQDLADAITDFKDMNSDIKEGLVAFINRNKPV